MEDFGFEPSLGRGSSGATPHGRKYLNTVIVEAARAGARLRTQARIFTGARIGRGAVAARMLRMDQTRVFGRRAIVKTRVVRMGPRAIAAARMHLNYIQRDGVKLDGGPGQLYCADEDDADGRLFLRPFAGDRHHFRLVVSPEDGAEYEELKPLIRRFMGCMEEDLGTKLAWVAADHVDTLHPHTHIMLRGSDDRGDGLVIAPDYVRYGMGDRVAGLVSLDLGPRTEAEIRQRLHLEVEAEQLTSIDRELFARMDDDCCVSAGGRDMSQHAIWTGRLRKLESLGLAEKLSGNRWQLGDDVEPMLRRLGQHGHAVRTVERDLAVAGVKRARAEQIVHRSSAAVLATGRVLAHGFSGDDNGRRYLIIDGLDGRCHHVELGSGEQPEPPAIGSIVRLGQGAANKTEAWQPYDIEILSTAPLEQLTHHDGDTWLDRELVSPSALIRDAGFGREVQRALALRRAWLVDNHLATMDKERFSCGPDMVAVLRRRERAAIVNETGLKIAAAEPAYARHAALFSRRSAVERSIGDPETGISKPEREVGWSFDRARGLGL